MYVSVNMFLYIIGPRKLLGDRDRRAALHSASCRPALRGQGQAFPQHLRGNCTKMGNYLFNTCGRILLRRQRALTEEGMVWSQEEAERGSAQEYQVPTPRERLSDHMGFPRPLTAVPPAPAQELFPCRKQLVFPWSANNF